MGLKLLLPEVRCSFLTLGEPKYYQDQKQRPDDQRRWSATALVPIDSLFKKKIDEALITLAKEAWPMKWQAQLKNILPDPKGCCWQDGERKEYDGYQGMWALSAHRPEKDGRPLVYDEKKHPLFYTEGANIHQPIPGKEGVIFAGCYVNMHVELWAQKSNGGGLRCSLLGIQKHPRNGDSFGGGSRPDDGAFGEMEDGADAGDMNGDLG